MPQHYDPREVEPKPIRGLRQRLLRIAGERYPEMVAELAANAYPLAVLAQSADQGQFSEFLNVRAGGPYAEFQIVNRRHYRPLLLAVENWASKWDPKGNQWILLAALDTVESWATAGRCGDNFEFAPERDVVAQAVDAQIERSPELMASREKMLSVRREIIAEQARTDLRVTVDLTESGKSSDQRLWEEAGSQLRQLRRILRSLRNLLPLGSANDKTLMWVARYHFGKMRFSTIAEMEGGFAADRVRTIRRAVKKAADTLRLELREPDPPGRRVAGARDIADQ